MWLKHWHVRGPAEKPLQVSGLWEIKESQCQSQYSCWHRNLPAGDVDVQNVSTYLTGGSYEFKGNDCEILKTKSSMQMFSSLSVAMFRITQVWIFQRDETGPNFEKDTVMEHTSNI